ncbi:ABC transporter permease [Streptococcus equi subsp. zooepidemicus]|uniref:ABC transporter permease n=1 Tax=Streptococcus equi TaxID=1336 RepID=UPI001E60DCCB|nr:ABC transporter permease [Streptococcus equi]MCD3437286.1 ABC transporter permease [Streptococcus equi subsp. zooepidemicus]MCD3438462.1 ABC transporter permease [Streptococcus equi subsp. zooepidemicus]MCD3438478.1 ABC transporter permease [Streptococcus equi subsp. zooepidemicus]
MIPFIKALFIKIRRKKTSYITFILLPMLTTMLALSLSFTGGSQAKIGILDKDKSQVSKQFVSQLKHNKKYQIYTRLEEKAIDQYLKAKTLEAVLTIEPGFGEKVLKGDTQKLALRSIADSQITEWFKAQANYLLENYNIIGDAAAGSQEVFKKISVHNTKLSYKVKEITLADRSQSKSVSSTTTGFLLILMLGSTSVLYGGILLDKSSQIYNRLVLSRLSRLQYMLSYVCVGIVAFAIQIVIMLGLLRVANVSFYIPTAIVLLTFFLYSLLAIGFGLMIGAVSKNAQQSSQLANLIVMPTSMLAGCLWPLSITPLYMQAIGKLLPQHWVLTIISTFQNGGNLGEAWPYFLALFVAAMTLMVLASVLMKPLHR